MIDYSKYSIQVNRVIDGDSLDIDIILGFGIVLQNRRLRLEGVDTPELRTSDEEEKQFGLRAKSFVVDWCSNRDLYVVVKNNGDEYDKFGRILGQIQDNEGNNLVTDIITNYHGVAYKGQNKNEIRKAHMDNRTKLFTI